MDDAAPAQFEDTSSFDHASTTQRLAAALAIARGGMSFIFVVCNGVPLRERIIADLRTRVSGTVTVELTSAEDDAFDAAVKATGEDRPAVLLITGLDIPLLSPDNGPAALTALNASRELWRSRFACPVVFFLSEAALPKVMRGAPDMWSRKSHIFEFFEPTQGSGAIFSPVSSALADDIAIWPPARRAARLVELQARIAQMTGVLAPAMHAERAKWLSECGHVFMAMGRLRDAADAFTQAAVDFEEGQDWNSLAHNTDFAAFSFQQFGDFQSALSQVDAALEKVKMKGMGNSLAEASLLNARAQLQQYQGDLPAARATMERSIAINEKHFAADHPTLAISYSNLAMIQQAQGDLPAARASMERAISINEKHFAADHPTLAISYNNLAMIQQDQGDLPAARASMVRAIAIDQKHFAPDHPNLAIRYNNLALICYAEGDRAAACANFKNALAILLKHFDENHPHVKAVRASIKGIGCRA